MMDNEFENYLETKFGREHTCWIRISKLYSTKELLCQFDDEGTFDCVLEVYAREIMNRGISEKNKLGVLLTIGKYLVND